MSIEATEATGSIEFCVLASGSSGNCAVVRSPAGAILIDAGIGPRTAAARLSGTGTSIADIAAICLTHLDRDHFNPNWVATLVEHRIRVYCHADRTDEFAEIVRESAAGRLGMQFASQIHSFDESFDPLPDVTVRAVPLSHDTAGSHGFLLAGDGGRIGYATDLGNVPDCLMEAFEELDVLALESNYDPQLQQQSGRPLFLQRRITGGRGHLSNEQAFKAVCALFDRCQRRGKSLPAHVVLLHRSRKCNCPNLVRALFGRDPRIAARLTLAEQFTRSEWLGRANRRPCHGEQLLLQLG